MVADEGMHRAVAALLDCAGAVEMPAIDDSSLCREDIMAGAGSHDAEERNGQMQAFKNCKTILTAPILSSRGPLHTALHLGDCSTNGPLTRFEDGRVRYHTRNHLLVDVPISIACRRRGSQILLLIRLYQSESERWHALKT